MKLTAVLSVHPSPKWLGPEGAASSAPVREKIQLIPIN